MERPLGETGSRVIPKRRSRRGTYDRRLSPSERVKAQRQELLTAVRRQVRAGTRLTVANIASLTGLGRSTFYEHFQTVEEALAACLAECEETFASALEPAWERSAVATPSERVRRVVTALLEFREREAERCVTLRTHGQERVVATLGGAVERMHEFYASAGAAKVPLSPVARRAATWALFGILACESDAECGVGLECRVDVGGSANVERSDALERSTNVERSVGAERAANAVGQVAEEASVLIGRLLR